MFSICLPLLLFQLTACCREATAISSVLIMFAIWLNIKSKNGLLLIPLSSQSTINVQEVSVTNSIQVHQLRIQNMDYSVKCVYTCWNTLDLFKNTLVVSARMAFIIIYYIMFSQFIEDYLCIHFLSPCSYCPGTQTLLCLPGYTLQPYTAAQINVRSGEGCCKSYQRGREWREFCDGKEGDVGGGSIS